MKRLVLFAVLLVVGGSLRAATGAAEGTVVISESLCLDLVTNAAQNYFASSKENKDKVDDFVTSLKAGAFPADTVSIDTTQGIELRAASVLYLLYLDKDLGLVDLPNSAQISACYKDSKEEYEKAKEGRTAPADIWSNQEYLFIWLVCRVADAAELDPEGRKKYLALIAQSLALKKSLYEVDEELRSRDALGSSAVQSSRVSGGGGGSGVAGDRGLA